MFDSVRNNKKIVQVFLALITLPFAFFGVDAYVRNSGAGNDLASVGDTKITTQQFEQGLRERQDQLRQNLGANFKPEIMNTFEVRKSVLNTLVDQRLLLLEAGKSRLSASDNMLRDVISKIPSLQENEQFSMARYESALRAQGISQTQFEEKLRQDMTLQQLIGTVGESAFVSTSQAEAMFRLQSEERQFSEFRIAPEQFADKVKIEASAVQKYYEDNISQFKVAEKIKAEYLVLSLDTLLSKVKVTEAEIKAWYESHKDRYQQPEERRASHILIVTGADKSKSKAKAEEVLQEVLKAPSSFADLAKKYSQDPGSAKNGGDLGFFGRGMMVKVFEDSAFKQKEGEISGVLESDFGFHIIKLTGIKPARTTPLDLVRSAIEVDLKRQAASRKYAESAESFNNMVYEQSDSLQPAAEAFNIGIQQSGWLTRNPDPKEMAALGPLSNEKIRASLFSEDAVKNKRNTEAVEIAPNTLLAARVLEFVPASTKPFESVKGEVEKMLRSREEEAMAKNSGETRLADLQKNSTGNVAWSSPKSISRLQARQMPRAAMNAIFKADAEKLPAYVGASVDGAYVLYKVVKVSSPEKIDAEKLKGLQAELTTIISGEDLSAYLSGLRARYKIEINTSLLTTKESQ